MPRNFFYEGNIYERYGLNREMEEAQLRTAYDVATEILRIIRSQGSLKTKDAVTIVWNQFGGKYTYTHSTGWMGLRLDVRKNLHALGKDQILYSGRHCYRLLDSIMEQNLSSSGNQKP